MRSRPWRSSRTRPAPARTVRCFVTAWRVIPVPSVRRVIDSGPPSASRDTSASRVSSPRAAKSGAASGSSATARFRVLAYAFELDLPAAGVALQRLGAPGDGDRIEARLGHGQARLLVAYGLQTELHQRHGLVGVVHVRVYTVR